MKENELVTNVTDFWRMEFDDVAKGSAENGVV
jgi:hypothetical protein